MFLSSNTFTDAKFYLFVGDIGPEVSTCIGEFSAHEFHNVSPAAFKAFAVK